MHGDNTSPMPHPTGRASTDDLAALALSGPAAAVAFAASLLGFAAARTDGYTHGTKAVSELGAIDAPNALAFNLLGFVLPGLLTALLALVLLRLAGSAASRTGPVLLAASGACMIAAGVFPFDLDDAASATSVLHLVGAMGAGLLWGAALFWVKPLLDRGLGLATWARVTPWFVLFLGANVAWQVGFRSGLGLLPGHGQRIAFAGYFVWLAITGWLVYRARRPRS